MDEYVREFVDETEPAITTLNNLLLDLERSPDDEECIEDIFRTAHTLKGNAGATGLDRVSDLAHAMEDVLDAIRSGDVDVTADRMDTLFAAVDCLETMVDEIVVEGDIRTDPADTIAALRAPISADPADVSPPSDDELAATLSRFSPPSTQGHEAYLVRMSIGESTDRNNGLVVVEALRDAFDLIGTDPSRTAIENQEYGKRIDAVFGTAVGVAAISAALEPVDAVEEFSILTVTDELEEAAAAENDMSSVDDNITADITSDEANEMSVDDLLDEFAELDDIDALAEEIDDASEFDDIGDAGSFDDIVSEPTTSPDGDDRAEAGSDTAEEASDSVDDAGAVFEELKEEVEMVGFDELQAELDELEFDEYDEEEVGMDELLGDDVDVDDPSFLEFEGSEDAGDSSRIETDVATSPAQESTPDTTEATWATDASSDAADPAVSEDELGSESAAGLASSESPVDDEPVSETESADAVMDSSDGDDAAGSSAFADELFAGDDADSPPDDGAPAGTDESAADTDEREEDLAETGDELFDPDPDESTTDPPAVDDSDVGQPPSDDIASEPSDTDVEPTWDSDGTNTPADPLVDASEPNPTETEATAGETDAVTDDGTSGADTDDATVESTEFEEPATGQDPVTDSTDELSFGDETDAFDLSTGLDDLESERFDDEVDPGASFDSSDTDADSSTFSEAEWDDETDDAYSLDAVDASTDLADSNDIDLDAGDEFGRPADSTGSGGGTDPSAYETDADSTETSGTDFDPDSDEDEVLARLPDMAIPDITVPTPSELESDTDLEAHAQSIRVDREQIDSLLQLVEGLVTSRVRLRSAVDSREPYESIERELDDLEAFTTELQETVMDVRLVPLQTVTDRLPRVVRDLARDQDKTVAFDQSNASVELDRGILDRIGDPLIHLVRNAVDHGIEDEETRSDAGKDPEGTIELSAERSQNRVSIEISDDGRGLDADRLRDEAVEAEILTREEADELSDGEAYDLVFHSGLSTAEEVTDVSGRGVGMDVVRRTIDELNGSVSIQSEPGEGTTITMTLPVSVAVDDVLFVESGGEQFGIPVDVVNDIGDGVDVTPTDDGLVYETEDETVPVMELGDALETGQSVVQDPDGMVVRVRDDVRDVGLKCDVVHARREVVLNPFEGFMRNVPGVSGATVRGRGEVITILDVTTL